MVRKKDLKIKKKRCNTIEKRADSFSELYGVSWKVADYALWIKKEHKNKTGQELPDKEAIKKSKEFWEKYGIAFEKKGGKNESSKNRKRTRTF